MPDLLEDHSPHGNAVAIVEQDERVAYLYLCRQEPEKTFSPCWLRNLLPAPAALVEEDMRNGRGPLMPAEHCAHPGGAAPLERERLRVVWSEEGDGVALYEGDSLLAVIPAWSGNGGFQGYARDAVGEGPLAWELGVENDSHRRYARAAGYWAAWADPDLWRRWRDERMAVLEAAYGRHAKYFSIDGNHWPPKALLLFPRGPHQVLVTVGMAMRPQPAVELVTDAPEGLRRIELGMCLPADLSGEDFREAGSWISGQSGYPWSRNSWLGPGHTMPSDVFKKLSGGRLPWALLWPELPAVPPVALPPSFDDPVRQLWLIPISDRERALAVKERSEALWKLLMERCRDRLADFSRPEAVLA